MLIKTKICTLKFWKIAMGLAVNQLFLPKLLFLRLALRLLVLGLLPGCVNYIGIHNKQQLATPDQFQTNVSLPNQNGAWPTTAWACQFGDPQLVTIINEALANNPDLQIAEARIFGASALVDSAHAKLLPNIKAQGFVSRDRLPANLLLPPPLGGSWRTAALALLNFNYELDFWGKNLALFSQALSNEKVSEVNEQASRLMIATMVASTYNQLAYEYALRDVLQKTVIQRGNLNKVTEVRVRNGLDTAVQLYQSRTQEATAKTDLTATQGQIITTRQQLGVLLGAGPDRGLAISRPKLHVFEKPKLPNNLPVNLLGRRPDIVAARWQVEAALYGVKNVKAKFYPDVNLLASAGFFSFGVTHLFRTSPDFVAVTPAVSLPIFDAGALRAKLRGQYATLDEAIATYNSALNKALGEVAEQLASIESTDKQLVVQQAALTNAKHAYDLARQQYGIGLTTQLVVLDVETRYLTEQQSRLLLIKTRRDLQIALIKALGGGFDAQEIN